MKKLLVALLLSTAPLLCYAQTSTGFSESDDFQYLINYHLPDWGYHNFSISSSNFGLQGYNFSDLRTRNNPGDPNYFRNDYNTNSNSVSIGISPEYEVYREGEKRILNLTTQLGFYSQLGLQNTEQEQTSGSTTLDNEADRSFRDSRVLHNVAFSSREYITDRFFLVARLSSSVRFDFDADHEKDNNNPSTLEKNLFRDIYLVPNLGVGFGKIRNVTPVLRALRLNERYKTLGNSSFTGDELTATSEEFTRLQGYQRRYDRPYKYFWDGVNTSTNQKIDQLTAYELFYLSDVLNENLGSRYEGYEVTLQGGYSYFNQLRRSVDRDDNVLYRTIQISRAASVRATGTWYKNLNLEHQLSLDTEISTTLPLERADYYDWNVETNTYLQWIWNIADRWNVSTYLMNNYLTTNLKDEDLGTARNLTSRLGNSVQYFIENHLSLTAGISLTRYYTKSYSSISAQEMQESTEFAWNLNVGLRYYFSRNLF